MGPHPVGRRQEFDGHPGFAGLAMLAGDDGHGGLVSLWLTREDAELTSQRSAAARGPRPFTLIRDEINQTSQPCGDQPALRACGVRAARRR